MESHEEQVKRSLWENSVKLFGTVGRMGWVPERREPQAMETIWFLQWSFPFPEVVPMWESITPSQAEDRGSPSKEKHLSKMKTES